MYTLTSICTAVRSSLPATTGQRCLNDHNCQDCHVPTNIIWIPASQISTDTWTASCSLCSMIGDLATELPILTTHSTTTTNCWRCCNNCLFGLRLLSHFRLVFLCRSHNIGEYCQIFSLHPTTPGSISLTGRLGAVVTWSHTTSIAPIPNSYLTVRLLYV